MSFPVVPLDSVPTAGIQAVLGEWARVAVAEGLDGAVSEFGGTLSVRRSGRHLLVEGELQGTATVVCDRCGDPLPLAVSGTVSCVYSPVDALPEVAEEEDRSGPVLPEGIPFTAEDVGEFDGIRLDLRDVVREFFAVERPARVICADADPAADAACSERWRARAGAPDPADSSPFSALKVLKPPR